MRKNQSFTKKKKIWQKIFYYKFIKVKWFWLISLFFWANERKNSKSWFYLMFDIRFPNLLTSKLAFRCTTRVSSGVETKSDSLKITLGLDKFIYSIFWSIAWFNPVRNSRYFLICMMKNNSALIWVIGFIETSQFWARSHLKLRQYMIEKIVFRVF